MSAVRVTADPGARSSAQPLLNPSGPFNSLQTCDTVTLDWSEGMLDNFTRRLGCLALLSALGFGAGSAVAGECDHLAQLAQQSAGYYRNSGDQRHWTAAQNYQNAYNACVSTVRRYTAPAPTGYDYANQALTGFTAILGILSDLNSLEDGRADDRGRAEEIAKIEEEQRELVRRQEEDMARALRAAADLRRRLKIQRQRDLAAAEAQRERCAEENPFGGSAAAQCGKTGATVASPFASAGSGIGVSPFASAGSGIGKSPFSTSNGGAPENPFQRVENEAVAHLNADPTYNPLYDSVNNVECPVLFVDGCVTDGVRAMLHLIEKHDGDTIAALRDAQSVAQGEDPLEFVISQEQYELIASGEATYEQIEAANRESFMAALMPYLESQLSSYRSDPDAQNALLRARLRNLDPEALSGIELPE